MYKFCFLIRMVSEESIQKLLANLKKQSNIDFEQDVQLIVVDVVSTRETEYIQKLKEYVNVTYLACPDGFTAACYEKGYPYCKAEYVAIIQSDCLYEKEDTLFSVKQCFLVNSEINLVSVAPFLQLPTGEKSRNDCQPAEAKQGILSVAEGVSNVQLLLDGYFIRAQFLKGFTMYKGGAEDGKNIFVLSLLHEAKQFYYMPAWHMIYETAAEDFYELFAYAGLKELYLESIEDLYLPAVKRWMQEDGAIPDFIAGTLTFLIYIRFFVNARERDKEQLNEKEVQQFIDDCCKVFSYFDYSYILQKSTIKKVKVDSFLVAEFLKITAQQKQEGYKFFYANGAYYFQSMPMIENTEEECPVFLVTDYKQAFIRILAINSFHNGTIAIDGLFSEAILHDVDTCKVFAKLNGKIKQVKTNTTYNLYKYFGIVMHTGISFQLRMKAEDIEQNTQIQFFVKLEDGAVMPKLGMFRAGARVSHLIPEQYYQFKSGKILTCRNNGLWIEEPVEGQLAVYDEKMLHASFLDTLPEETKQNCIALRKLYYQSRAKYAKRRIWITFDRLYKGGDNGEYAFREINAIRGKVEIYYILREDAPEYTQMKKTCQNVVAYGSMESKLLSLFAEVILTPHFGVMDYCGFTKDEAPYFWDLFNAEVVCIQHGLTVQNIAQWQNRLLDNIKLYLCASRYEIENLKQDIYGYRENQLRLVGMARYDGLKSHNQKQVLISPTWRRNLVKKRLGHNKNEYNEQFVKSAYYKCYNALIHDERLLENARKNKYRIIFLLHPVMGAQQRDFKGNDVVQVLAASDDVNYEKMLTESDIMVTDYSGIQFDFAYMRKPILYYHPSVLPSHYTESAFYKYKEQGFGPIVTEQDELVTRLCHLMDTNGKNEQQYIDRANDFFAFDDYSNCSRIYKTVDEYMKVSGLVEYTLKEKIENKCKKNGKK